MDRTAIRGAVYARKKYILDNLETLSLKQLRKLICSEDFELPEKALDAEKDFFKAVVDELIAATPAAAPEQPRPKKQKTAAKGQQQKEPVAITAGPQYGSRVEAMRGICRAATITIPPNVYVKVSSAQDVEDRLLALLAKHDLTEQAAPEDIARVRRGLQKARDLDGIDSGNIMSGGRSRTKKFTVQQAATSSDSDVDEAAGIENRKPVNQPPTDAGVRPAMTKVLEKVPSAYGENGEEEDLGCQAGTEPQRARRPVAAWSDDDD